MIAPSLQMANTRTVIKGLEKLRICQQREPTPEQDWEAFLADSPTSRPALNIQVNQNTTARLQDACKLLESTEALHSFIQRAKASTACTNRITNSAHSSTILDLVFSQKLPQ